MSLTLISYPERLSPFGHFSVLPDAVDPFSRLFADLTDTALHPRIEAEELDESYQLTLTLPGFKRGEIDIEVKRDGVLSIKAEQKGVGRKQTLQSVQRSITLSPDVDPDKVEAKLEDGILTITVPKAPTARPRRVVVT